MLDEKHLYDFSAYPTDHPNYDITNKKVLMKLKDELNSRIMLVFIGLKPKMQSLEYIDNSVIAYKNKCKGVKKTVDLKHDEYKRSLYKEQLIYRKTI